MLAKKDHAVQGDQAKSDGMSLPSSRIKYLRRKNGISCKVSSLSSYTIPECW